MIITMVSDKIVTSGSEDFVQFSEIFCVEGRNGVGGRGKKGAYS